MVLYSASICLGKVLYSASICLDKVLYSASICLDKVLYSASICLDKVLYSASVCLDKVLYSASICLDKVLYSASICLDKVLYSASISIRTRENRTFMVEMQFGIDVLSFFQKIAIVSDVFKVIGSLFQTLGAATEKARLPKLRFVLDTISCCEIDDLSCLGIFKRCRRLGK